MITAKNYAAQAQQAALKNSATKEAAFTISRVIPISQHFAIPDGGKILDDGLRGLEGMDINLPFPSVTVECLCDGCKYCVIAIQHDSTVVILFAVNTSGDWVIPDFSCVYKGLDRGEIHAEFTGKQAAVFQDQPLIHFLALTVLELCEALACSNVDSEVIESVDQRKNGKRIRQGKLPLYETRRLVIKTPLARSVGGCAEGGSGHRSPREHLRRGHVRMLSNGRRIWVNSCVVGNRANGVINKSYGVTT